MKLRTEEREFTKLCHARPGDVVQLIDSMCVGDPTKAYLVVMADHHIPSSWGNNGLYSAEHVALIDVETGTPIRVPNLSSPCVIYRHAEVRLNRNEKTINTVGFGIGLGIGVPK